jgi:hypothetical protein
MSNDYELPPMPQAVDVTPVSWSNLFSADQMREYALLAVQRERERIEASQVVQYLYGADLLDGRGFGDGPPDGKPRYWWRSQLRAAIRKGQP